MRAMILAAGRGERMRPLTDHCPKPLLSAGGRPLIAWHLEKLASAGIRDVVVNHAHLGHLIEAAVGDGAAWGLRVRYSPEPEALETAGGIATALHHLVPGPFLVVNGDVFTDLDYGAFAAHAAAAFGKAPARLAHLMLADNPPHHLLGDFALEGADVREEGADRLTFGGLGLYRPELFAGIAPGTRAKLAPLLRDAMRAGRVSGEHHRGYWVDVGTPDRLAELDLHLRAAAPPSEDSPP